MPSQSSTSRATFLLLLATLLPAMPAMSFAQEAVQAPQEEVTYDPDTGDAWLDRHLADINVYAERYPNAFADELSRYYAVPRAYVEALLQQPAWTAGDAFMACALAQRASQSCRTVVREWSRDHGEGWAGVAERLEVEPGSAEHRKLREDVRSSYRRWARPLLEK